MGILDLSTNSFAKRHVDLNDARYQMADRLRFSDKKNARPTFTLYDSKKLGETTVKEISVAYALSDKKLPVGELLNKMIDTIIDVEDGVLDNEKDAIYAWRYSAAILGIYEDKIKNKRQDSLSAFDNGFKNAVLSSQEFANKYPGKYTNRTNFFDAKIKAALISDVVDVFRTVTLPKLHAFAIKQSETVANIHDNPTLNKIVQWAVDNYNCEVESYYDVKNDPNNGLFYSVNTIILHLKNGHDMSIVGFVGTDHDDQFSVSVLNTCDASVERHDEKIESTGIQDVLEQASSMEEISPLVAILESEERRRDALKAQYDLLYSIRPMIKKEILELKAAESVVGKDYIWSCANQREEYGDLPENFKLEDIIPLDMIEAAKKKEDPYKDVYSDSAMMSVGDESTPEFDNQDELFPQEQSEKRTASPKFGDITNEEMPVLSTMTQPTRVEEKANASDFDIAGALLPGSNIIGEQSSKQIPSYTGKAEPMPNPERSSIWKEPDNINEIKNNVNSNNDKQDESSSATPELVLTDIDSLFA